MLDYESAVDAAPSGARKPFLEGDVDGKFLVIRSENTAGYTGNKYVIELRVLEATPTSADAKCPVVGAERVVIVDLDSETYGHSNLMAYVHGLNGGPITGDTKEVRGAKLRKLLGVREMDEDEAKKKGVAATKGQEAYAVGMVIGNRTNKGETKKKTPFTYHNWYTLAQTHEQIGARKSAIKTGGTITLTADNVAV